MKHLKSIISFFLIVVASLASGTVIAQPVLQGSPSFDNFVGSPGMWVICAGLTFIAIIAVFLKRRDKFQPEPFKKN